MKTKDELRVNEINKLEELRNLAIDRYLDKNDFDCVDWMTEPEQREYARLYFKEVGECTLCGDESGECDHLKKAVNV